MARIFGIGNKKGSGGSVPGGGSIARNSETDSETLSAILDLNNRLKTRNIKAKLVVGRNHLFIRGTFIDSDGIKKERKIPTRLSADKNNLVSAEARILTLVEYVNKNGFMPDQLMWDAPKIELKGVSKGITVNEAIKIFELDYWKDKDRNKLPKQQTWKGILGHLNKLPQSATLNMGV